ncbi:MAG: hypothetical protein IPQ13_04285 [Holophagaceae bacterium]|nr:hypothetical protein [Holophagaceae bacterium]
MPNEQSYPTGGIFSKRLEADSADSVFQSAPKVNIKSGILGVATEANVVVLL